MHARGIDQIQYRDQHQQRADHREQNAFDGGVDFAPVTTDANQEVHRNQHQLPEHVEQEQIDREQSSEQPGLEHQHEKAELAGPFLDIAAARIKQRQSNQHSSQ